MNDSELLDWISDNCENLSFRKDKGGILAELDNPGIIDTPAVVAPDFRSAVIALAGYVPKERKICPDCKGGCILPGCPTCGVTYHAFHESRLNRQKVIYSHQIR